MATEAAYDPDAALSHDLNAVSLNRSAQVWFE